MTTRNRHTFLFEPGRWKAAGYLNDEKGAATSVQGWAEVEHGREHWRLTATMGEIVNCYTIVPFAPGALSTTWRSENPSLGGLRGHFAVAGDAILCQFQTEDGRYHGCEYLRRLSDQRYENGGVLFCGSARVSSWAMELTRSRT